MASDKLFYFLFHNTPDLILRWLQDLPADAGGYRFSAPALKEREHRLDGLFSPPEHRDDLPAVILEAQIKEDPTFLLRLYAESARFLQQECWQREWQVVVICPHRQMNFGSLTPVREFVEHRVRWVELQPKNQPTPREPLTQALSLLVQPEPQLRSVHDALRQQALTDARAAEVLPLIPAIVLVRFNKRPLQEISEMIGITFEDFTQSPAYQEIFVLGEARGEARGREVGRQEGRAEGRQSEAAAMTLRLLRRRCGTLNQATTLQIQALPLEQLEALADALLDFQDPNDLAAWLGTHT